MISNILHKPIYPLLAYFVDLPYLHLRIPPPSKNMQVKSLMPPPNALLLLVKMTTMGWIAWLVLRKSGILCTNCLCYLQVIELGYFTHIISSIIVRNAD